MRAFITGGTRGIGRAIVEALLPQLEELTVLAKNGKRQEELAAYIGSHNPKCRFEPLIHDLVDLNGLSRTLRDWSSAQRLRQLDVLVMNAGTYTEGALLDIDNEIYLRDLDVNLNSYLVTAKTLVPCLRVGIRKRIFIVGSTAAYEAYPAVPTYGIAKAALRSLARNLRHELISDRIGVTYIAPGGTLTDMREGEDISPHRLLDPSDIGSLVAACLNLSEQAVVEEIIVRPMEGDIHE